MSAKRQRSGVKIFKPTAKPRHLFKKQTYFARLPNADLLTIKKKKSRKIKSYVDKWIATRPITSFVCEFFSNLEIGFF